MSDAIKDPCEWNPTANRASWVSEVHSPADWIVGSKGNWRLCDSCAKLAIFNRFKARKRIDRSVPLETGTETKTS